MKRYIVRGGKPLFGVVEAQGAKNAAVAVLMACVAVNGVVTLKRVPRISDVAACVEILRYLGASVEWLEDDVLSVDARGIKTRKIPATLTRSMRASSYLMGAMLARFGACDVSLPGGCELGARPLNYHYSAFETLGAHQVECGGDGVCFECLDGNLVGGVIRFPGVTVGGTVNALIAASCAEGCTVIKNAAREPHVCELARFLCFCGADVAGIGSSELSVRGVSCLRGCEYELGGDMIEAGTYLIAGAVTRGEVLVRGVASEELVSLLSVLERMGVRVKVGDDFVGVVGGGLMRGTMVETSPYPGFPTDLHPQLSVLMGVSEGASVIREKVFLSDRFGYFGELSRMGVRGYAEGNMLNLFGGTVLNCASVSAVDLRGGAALLIAALGAFGESVIGGVEYIERGYSRVVEKLRAMGADICIEECDCIE